MILRHQLGSFETVEKVGSRRDPVLVAYSTDVTGMMHV